MAEREKNLLSAACKCGKVILEARFRPILAAACYCGCCREAGRRIEQMPDAPPVLNPGFGTDYLLFRKDRIRCVAGAQYLTEHRLKPHSPTRRVVARCCNSAMFLDFTKGHWLSLYRDRFGADAPPIAMRIMTKYREEGVVLDDALPNYPVPNRKILLPLLAAWVAMGFRRPQIGWGKGELTP